MIDTEDDHPSNMSVRAGYLVGLAERLEGEDREMCLRASRSLLAAADQRRDQRDASIRDLVERNACMHQKDIDRVRDRLWTIEQRLGIER